MAIIEGLEPPPPPPWFTEGLDVIHAALSELRGRDGAVMKRLDSLEKRIEALEKVAHLPSIFDGIV